MFKASLASLLAFAIGASAHTYIWSVWVNGVDQGSGFGLRQPAHNGPPGIGYANSPVRDLNSIDLRCNVLGDVPNPGTIQVLPNDVVTLEWHHNWRNASDDIIASSHHGAGLVYISPNPPTNNSWVKIQEEGLVDGVWYVTGKNTERLGKQDVQIPAGLAPGYYLLKGEFSALHQAEVSYLATQEGIQFYITCVQIEVLGNGSVVLPPGVDFPGAYKYTDPGIVYNIYVTQTAPYPIPGPTVWSGAAPSPDPPEYGTTLGYSVAPNWSTWIGTAFSSTTSLTSVTFVTAGATSTTAYVPNWPTTYVPPPAATPPP